MNSRTAPRRKSNSEQQRERLLRAAVKVVAQHGFAGASVQRITSECGLSQGSLYTYFDSLQALLDELLPIEGLRMLEKLRKGAERADGYFDMERKTFEVLIDYLRIRPVMYRLATEGEFATPAGYRQHFDNIVVRYLRAMKRGQAQGEVRADLDDSSLEIAARILSYVRGGVVRGFCDPDARRLLQPRALPAWLPETFERFLRHGIGAAAPIPPSRRRWPPRELPQRSPGMAASSPHGPEATRERILNAAMELIGTHGESATSVAAICERANVGIGTIYGHFPARGDLLPRALDRARRMLLEALDVSTQDCRSYLDYEARAFDGYFDFVQTYPWYPRLETEAAVNAPTAFLAHVHAMSAVALRAITTRRTPPEFEAFTQDEWPVISHIAVAARHFLAIPPSPDSAAVSRPDEKTRRVWLEVLGRGLQSRDIPGEPRP